MLPEYFRPTEVDELIGDASKARDLLGWAPRHTLKDIVREMVQSDMVHFQKAKILQSLGHNVSLESID